MKKLIKGVFYKDNNNVLGVIRISSSIFGALSLAYLSIMYIAKFLHFTIFENIVIGIILLPIFWSTFGLWIVMSQTKFNAILKTIIPFIILYIFVFVVR